MRQPEAVAARRDRAPSPNGGAADGAPTTSARTLAIAVAAAADAKEKRRKTERRQREVGGGSLHCRRVCAGAPDGFIIVLAAKKKG